MSRREEEKRNEKRGTKCEEVKRRRRDEEMRRDFLTRNTKPVTRNIGGMKNNIKKSLNSIGETYCSSKTKKDEK